MMACRFRFIGASRFNNGIRLFAVIKTLKGDKMVSAILAPMSKLGGSVGLKVVRLDGPDTVPLIDASDLDLPIAVVDAYLAMTAWSVAGHLDTAVTVLPTHVFHYLSARLAAVEHLMD